MSKEAYANPEFDSRMEQFELGIPYFKEKIDGLLIVLVIISSAVILFLSLKFRIFHLWADFLNSTLFLKLATYPLLVSAVIIVSGLIFRTILWFRYKPLTIRGENVDWPSVSVIMPALNEEELVEKSIDSLFMSDKAKNTKLDDFF